MDRKKVDIYVAHTIRGAKAHDAVYGYILETETASKQIGTLTDFGKAVDFTAHELELFAILQALKRITKPCELFIHSSHGWFDHIFNSKRIFTWRESNWKKADGNEVKNSDLMSEILDFTESHNHLIKYADSSLGEYRYYLPHEIEKKRG